MRTRGPALEGLVGILLAGLLLAGVVLLRGAERAAVAQQGVTVFEEIAVTSTADDAVRVAGGVEIDGPVTFGGTLAVTGDLSVTGGVTAATVAGNGAALTNLDAANITQNRLARLRLPPGTIVDVAYHGPLGSEPSTTSSTYQSTGFEISLTLDRASNAILFESGAIQSGRTTGGGSNRTCQLRLRETISDVVIWEGSSGSNSRFPNLLGDFPFSMTGPHNFLFEFRRTGGSIGSCQFLSGTLVLHEIAG